MPNNDACSVHFYSRHLQNSSFPHTMKEDAGRRFPRALRILRSSSAALVFLICLALFLPLEVLAQPVFPCPQFDVAATPVAVKLADFNGDGKLDLVTANQSPFGSISVLLGNGDGTFQARTDYLLPLVDSMIPTPESVAVGDFNKDGKMDIVTANFGSHGTVSLFVGNGDGTFQGGVNYNTGSAPFSISVGDFNKDGNLDIVTASTDQAGGSISILLGNGDGTFQAKQDYPAGNYPFSLVVADFNKDGKLDIVTANRGNNTNSISVFLGNGDGTFQPKTDYPVALAPLSIATDDFNKDGKPDLVLSNTTGSVTVLLGNGDGTFQAGQDYAVGAFPNSVAIGDFDGDGKPDIVTANTNGNSVSVLLGNGDGTFQVAVHYGVGGKPSCVSLDDVNKDGILDIVTGNRNGSAGILLGKSDGTFRARKDYSVSGYAWGLIAIDINKDGIPDLISANLNNSAASVLLGNGDGTFQTQQDYPTGIYPLAVAVADFNKDGKPDIVTTGFSNTISVLLGNGDGTFQPNQDYSVGDSPYFVAIDDFNKDGKLDVVTVNYSGNSISVLLGNGDGTFQTKMDFPVGSAPTSVAVADFNGDGKPDIVVAYQSGNSVSVLLGNGDGTFQAKHDYATDTFSGSVAVGDFNKDDKMDIVTANSSGTVSVLLGNGDGTFQAKQDFAVGIGPVSIAVGDFNNDGKPDIVTASGGIDINTVSVLLGNGDGTFQDKIDYSISSFAFAVAIGDFNRDGKLDIAATVPDVGAISVLLNQLVSSPTVSGLLTLDGIDANAPAQKITFTFRPIYGGNDIVKTANVGPNGTFSLHGVPSGSYTLHIKGDKYLAANIAPVTIHNGNVSGLAATLLAGDANNDNGVDFDDLTILAIAYNTTIGDDTGLYDDRADFNGDGQVEFADLTLLAINYNLEGDP